MVRRKQEKGKSKERVFEDSKGISAYVKNETGFQEVIFYLPKWIGKYVRDSYADNYVRLIRESVENMKSVIQKYNTEDQKWGVQIIPIVLPNRKGERRFLKESVNIEKKVKIGDILQIFIFIKALKNLNKIESQNISVDEVIEVIKALPSEEYKALVDEVTENMKKQSLIRVDYIVKEEIKEVDYMFFDYPVFTIY